MKTISEDLFENINRIDLLKVSAIASVNLTVHCISVFLSLTP